MKEVFYQNNSTHCRVVTYVFFTSATTPSGVWGSTTSASDFLLPWWAYFKKTRFLQVNALKITHLLAVSSLMFRNALWLWKLLMISSHSVPLWELIHAPASESDENFAWRKSAELESAPICFSSCITKCLFTFFHFAQLGQLNPWVILLLFQISWIPWFTDLPGVL